MKDFFKIIKMPLSFFSLVILSIGIPVLIVSCSSSSEYISEKMDTSLQQKIRQLEKEDPSTIVQFTGKTIAPISDEMKTTLESTGIKTESIVKDIFTASGNIESIKKLTLLDYVTYLELVKKLDLK